MKRYLLAILLAGCTDKANIGMSNQPVKCQPSAAGLVNGSVTNTTTHQSYSFGTPAVTLGGANGSTGSNSISLNDTKLNLSLTFQCGVPAVGTYDPAGGQPGCPLSVLGTISGELQQVYGVADAGEVIVDTTTGCIAGRFDLMYQANTDQPPTSGELAGWFSVPLP